MITKSKKEYLNGWANKHSFIEQKDGPKFRVYGKYWLHGLVFSFYLNEQISGKSLMKGIISIISPMDGKLMKIECVHLVSSDESKDAPSQEVTSEESGDAPSQEVTSNKSKDKPTHKVISRSVYCNSRDMEDIKKAVARAASILYRDNFTMLTELLQKSVRAESITPDVAARLYAQKFVNDRYGDTQNDTQARKIVLLEKLFTDLPDMPMVQYDLKLVSTHIKDNKISVTNQKLMAEFWMWITKKLHLNQSCPFPSLPKKRVSRKIIQMRASIPAELDLPMQDMLYKRLADAAPGVKCGIALMLWGGVSASYAVSCHWSDVLFQGDNVLLLIRRDELAGATHDYRRPLFMQAAIILKERYQELLQQNFSEADIANMPIISQKKKADTAMTANELNQNMRTLLRSAGLSDAMFQAWKTHGYAVTSRLFTQTYQKNITMNCGFGPDNQGIIDFLMGRSLAGDTTSCSYTSFTCPEAVDRIVTAMAPLGPLEALEPVTEKETLPNGMEQYAFAPETNRDSVHVTGAFTVPPGGILDLSCIHGVEGSVKMRELTPDGKKRRAPSNKKQAG